MEAVDLARSALSRAQRSKTPNVFSAMKDLYVVGVVAIVVAEVGLLQKLAELILTQSIEPFPLKSVNLTKGRDIVSSATRRGTDSSNAPS
jgi:IS4 transposase